MTSSNPLKVTSMTAPAMLQAKTSKEDVANILVADLLALEVCIDTALTHAHSIGQTLSNGRIAAGVSATVGQAMFDDLARVTSAAVALRGQTVVLHNRMDRHAKRMGVTVRPSTLEKPPVNPDEPETPWPGGALQTTQD